MHRHRVRLDFDGPIQYDENHAEIACLGWCQIHQVRMSGMYTGGTEMSGIA